MASGLIPGNAMAGATTIMPRLRQRVEIDGRRRSDVHCLGVSYSHGSTGSTASLQVPALDWDGGKASFRGKRVRIDAGYEGGPMETIFVGYLTRPTGSTDGRMIEIGAVSMLGLADGVYVGEGVTEGSMMVRYPKTALAPGGGEQATGWTVAGVLRDLFGSGVATWRGGGGQLPSQWRAVMKLGNTGVLNSVFSQMPLGDLAWNQVTLRDALGELMGLVGNVSFRERFRGNVTYLDFFELGYISGGAKSVRVSEAGKSASGTNALTVSHEEAAEDSRSRVIGLGGRKKTVVSLRSDGGANGLQRDWDANLEPIVLANPEAGKRSGQGDGGDARPEYSEILSKVFRRYRLPEGLRGLLIDEENAVLLSDGSRLPIQVWKIAPELDWNANEGKWESGTTGPVLLEGAEVDMTNRVIVLKEPGINMTESSDEGDVYQEAVIGVTLTVAGSRLRWDTGAKGGGVEFSGLGDGLSQVIANDSFGFRRAGNAIYPTTLVLIPGQEWVVYDGPFTFQDDTTALRQFSEASLREMDRARVTYGVTTPYCTAAFRLGDSIRMTQGQRDADMGVNQVLSISHDLTTNHSTTFSTDNALPLINQEVLSGG